jgi:DNA-binding NarL/FixJ family response regulator
MDQSLATTNQYTFVVIDDHDRMVDGTVTQLKQKYRDVEIHTAQNAQDALKKIREVKPNLAIVDLAIPEVEGEPARTDAGVKLLKTLLGQEPEQKPKPEPEPEPSLNIVVQSDNFKALVQVKLAINRHKGGFTIVAKSEPAQVFLERVDWALKGLVFTPREIRSGLELRPEWLEVLQLGCNEALQDEEIAKKMNVCQKTVNNYWAKIRDVLEIYPDPDEKKDKNIRMLTAVRARQFGLLN